MKFDVRPEEYDIIIRGLDVIASYNKDWQDKSKDHPGSASIWQKRIDEIYEVKRQLANQYALMNKEERK